MTARSIRSGAAALALLALAACGERPQTMDAAAKKSDTAPWARSDAANPAFAAAGWKGGDQAAWDAQIRARNQAQNDYAPR
jgi:hypothetical protein